MSRLKSTVGESATARWPPIPVMAIAASCRHVRSLGSHQVGSGSVRSSRRRAWARCLTREPRARPAIGMSRVPAGSGGVETTEDQDIEILRVVSNAGSTENSREASAIRDGPRGIPGEDDDRHADHDRRAGADAGDRVHLPRPAAAGDARQSRCPRARPPRPAGSTSSCSAGTGPPSGWCSPSPASGEIYAEIPLDPLYNRTGDHWHVRVDGLPEEFCYGYRVDGPGRRRPLLRPH